MRQQLRRRAAIMQSILLEPEPRRRLGAMNQISALREVAGGDGRGAQRGRTIRSTHTEKFDLPPEQARSVPQVPGSLQESLRALEEDHEFLRAGDVFTSDVIETWISYKRTHEIDPVRPHPWEFHLYFDV
jgi:Glutamine synthetase, catalytic domain